jgi:hypothetical protein
LCNLHEDPNEITRLDFVAKVILQEARLEERLTNQLLVTMLSAYSKNPINLLINAPSGVGKNYVINKVASVFPKADILPLAGMTEKALFHRPGTLVIKDEITGEYKSIETQLTDIEEHIREKQIELSQTKDRNERQQLKNSIKIIEERKKDLLKDSKKLIDLSNKIIIFLDTPPEKLLSGLLPLLSHDEYEIEYEYVDTNNGIKTKSNILRGWPAVIIAQASDYSKSPRFQEYQRRFITTNPTMSKEKFGEAINLILNKSSVPDLIYQHKIISDYEKDKAREIIKDLKEQIQAICNELEPGKNNVIIPFDDLIRQLIPKEKASDMTRTNRLSTYLLFLPLIHFEKRPRIEIGIDGDILSKQIIPIATFEDLQNTTSLMKYSDGVRPYILEWYYDIFLKAFEEKGDKVDTKTNNKGETLEEPRVALTSQDIIKKHKEEHNETLTSKQLLESRLYPLSNQGYIDKIESVIDRRANIYFPIISTRKYINLFENEESNNFLQQKEKIIINSTKVISKEYIISKIRPILKYYSENGFYTKIKNNLDEEITLEKLVEQYFGNVEDYFKIEDNNHSSYSTAEVERGGEEKEEKNQQKEETEKNIDSSAISTSNPNSTTTEKEEKNNFSKSGFVEEYLQRVENIELLQQNLGEDIKIATNSGKADKKLFDSAKTNKIIYSNNDSKS